MLITEGCKALLQLCYVCPVPKKTLPEIYVDEHIKPPVIEAFEECGFKCIQISKTKKYAGRNEDDYIEEIYSEGRLFATSDVQFRKRVLAKKNKVKRAGIVEIPPDVDYEDIGRVIGLLAGCVEGYIEAFGKNSLRNHVLYVAHDGFHLVDEKGKDLLRYSFEALDIDLKRWT